MAPHVPEEVNVFSIPHSRMKELVNAYVDMIKKTNFTNDLELELLLESLLRTFMEFKTHEQIENQFIMKKLKNKLRQLSIKNSAVCNCHSDDSLSEMMHFIEKGYRKKTEQDRVNFGVQLKQALEEFTDSFLPHMKEEEEVFQPLLLQYFSYEELRDLRQKVIQQHIITEQGQLLREQTANSAGQKRNFAKVQQKEKSDVSKTDEVGDIRNQESCYISNLPPEIMMKIFSHLTPQALGRCRQVNHEWSRLALAPELWKDIIPVQWAQGQWEHVEDESSDIDDEDDNCTGTDGEFTDDEYAAIDDVTLDEETDDTDVMTDSQHLIQREAEILTGLVKSVLPRAGKGVKKLILKHSKAITNGMLNKILQLCPNIEILDLTQTRISDQGLQWLGKFGVGSKLKKVIFSGCENISDATLVRLAMAQHQSLKVVRRRPYYCPFSAPQEGNTVTVHAKPKLKHKAAFSTPEPVHESMVDIHQQIELDGDMEESEQDFCCQETDAGNGVCCSEVQELMESTSDPRDCLCEAYFNECHQPIEGGCGMKITTTCRSIGQRKSAPTRNSVMNERSTGCCKRGRYKYSNHMDTQFASMPDDWLKMPGFNKRTTMTKKDPDSDLDLTMLSIGDVSLNDAHAFNVPDPYNGDVQNPQRKAPYLVSMREKPEHYSAPEFTPSNDLDVLDTLNNDSSPGEKNCHANCTKDGGMNSADDFELDAIEDCVPRDGKWTRDERTLKTETEKPDFRLEHLNLSGCFRVTDVGIRALGRIGRFPHLELLDLSGCFRLTADGIESLVSVCPALGTGLYYCDNIEDGPLSEEAGGCRNLGCGSRVCCRSGQ